LEEINTRTILETKPQVKKDETTEQTTQEIKTQIVENIKTEIFEEIKLNQEVFL